MRIEEKKLKELLVDPGFVSLKDFQAGADEAKSMNLPLADVLIKSNLIKDEELGRLVAEHIKAPFVDLKQEKVDREAVRTIPESVARHKGVIIFGKDKTVFKVGMTDPGDEEMRRMLEKRLGKIKVYYITERDCESALSRYQGNVKEIFEDIMDDLRNETDQEKKDMAVIRMVDMILEAGYSSKASDIHIEPHEDRVLVRFRMDGVMHDIIGMPKVLFDPAVSRIKILCKMRTDEHLAPQDGKMRFAAPGESVDIRVSVMPTVWGEKIVMRILTAQGKQYDLADLGLSEKNLKKISQAMANPHGMILVTGPTGSGKTTTVYGVLKILNTREVNITTIEDPIEYYIDGVSQTQVNRKADLTFARGLRAIVRQDPDIIMVGEIRDEETASIAINSAMTGHLVLSTLHANDSATTIPRLLDMGIEPFLVASTVNAAIGQRLVRKICPKCRTSAKLEEEEARILKLIPNVMKILDEMGHGNLEDLWLYKGAGCEVCNFTGFSGRIGVFEILEMDDGLRELVITRASSDKLMEAAKAAGMTTMLQDGIAKAFSGITTLMEVARVTKE